MKSITFLPRATSQLSIIYKEIQANRLHQELTQCVSHMVGSPRGYSLWEHKFPQKTSFLISNQFSQTWGLWLIIMQMSVITTSAPHTMLTGSYSLLITLGPSGKTRFFPRSVPGELTQQAAQSLQSSTRLTLKLHPSYPYLGSPCYSLPHTGPRWPITCTCRSCPLVSLSHV